ncbi:alpha/beta fold hydrolase [Dietzia sp. UCD-THP]|uniref:alpha/beta fold hydrolase n=1 Tax=Dietzia sp. UCD-THP TaxID=1292020 RepID=UPI001EE65DBB|nr:alpha/beta fold hydrolase [Dietzia sp. UCD-THP]
MSRGGPHDGHCLSPGLHGDAQTWAPVMRALPDGVHATPLDLPAVADLDALVDEVAGRVAPGSVVVGHSLGGVVAMHLAERHPSLLADSSWSPPR